MRKCLYEAAHLFTGLIVWRFELIYHDRQQLAQHLRYQVMVST
jgi:hypothetical protein